MVLDRTAQRRGTRVTHSHSREPENRTPAQGRHDDRWSRKNGNAIWLLFISVALFGALAYAFLQGLRPNLSIITNEAAKTAAYKSQDCGNAVNIGMKRLEARGCGNLISLESDGSNPHAGAPADGSCSIYHPDGGGVAPCDVVIATPSIDPCMTGAIGTVCTTDAAIYIGNMDGNRICAASADESGTFRWKTNNTTTPDTGSLTDGPANTAAMIAAGASAHPAANACNTKTPAGTWYLPAREEWKLVWTHRTEIDLADKNFSTGSPHYWSSSQSSMLHGSFLILSSGLQSFGTKTSPKRVRCVRR